MFFEFIVSDAVNQVAEGVVIGVSVVQVEEDDAGEGR